jgi:DNA-binding PadR family transcriptional regulator
VAALKTSSFLILGLIRGGIGTGYAIRQAIEQMRMSVFWGVSFAQIYPELAQLESEGYVISRDDPQGARARRTYRLTEAGEAALLTWLASPEIPPPDVRDEGLMRLGFGDHLPPEEGVEIVRRLRERAEQSEREFREEVMPPAEALAQLGHRYPQLVARMGAEYNAWAAGFFAEIEAELIAESEKPG